MDKRRLHLSSLIVSNQVSRDEALAELAKSIADDVQSARDLRFIAKKLRISKEELSQMIEDRPVLHSEYPSDFALQQALLNTRAFWRGRLRKAAA